MVSWIATSYLLAVAVSLVPFGRMADIYGRKRTFACGIAVFTFSSLFSALSVSASMLIVFRVIQGVGSALVFATGIAILTSVFPSSERGRALGINVAAVYIGLSVGPFLGGFLTQHFTWRSIFLATVPLGMIIIVIVAWKLTGEWAEAKGEEFDLPGSLIYGFAVVVLMYGISILPAIRSLWLILSGIAGIIAFVKWELRAANPVFELDLFRNNRVFALSNLAALVNYSATFAVAFLLSLYLQHIRQMSPQGAGLLLLAQPVVQAIFSPLAGRLSDRIEPRIVASIGMALTTLGLFFFIFMGEDSTLSMIIARLVLIGFGFAFFSFPNTNAIMGSVGKRFYGLASGSVGTMRSLGMMISMGIATLIFAIFMGRVQITVEYSPLFLRSMRTAFVVFCLLCFGGVFASLARGKAEPGNKKSQT
jgi:EmrB/QacA subfamily drug resistance transporter